MSGLKDKASRINFTGLPGVVNSDAAVVGADGDVRRPKTAPGLMMATAVDQRSQIVVENQRLSESVVALKAEVEATKEEEKRLRGQLQDVLHDVAQWDGAKATRLLDCGLVVRSRWANRDLQSFVGRDFEELREEISSAGGNVQPVKVRPAVVSGESKFELVYGHRRFEACRQLGLPVLAMIDSVDDQALFVEMDRENRQRKNLSPWEQGVMYLRALEEGLWPSNRKMAEALGVDLTNLGRALALARLPAEVVRAFSSPLDLQFRWAAPLAAAVESDQSRVFSCASEIAASSPRPSPGEVFHMLTTAKLGGSTVLPPEKPPMAYSILRRGKPVGNIVRDGKSGEVRVLLKGAEARALDLEKLQSAIVELLS